MIVACISLHGSFHLVVGMRFQVVTSVRRLLFRASISVLPSDKAEMPLKTRQDCALLF
jgi:hypothetical protein